MAMSSRETRVRRERRCPGGRRRVVQRDEGEARERGRGTAPTFTGLAARGGGHPEAKRHHLNRVLRLSPTPYVACELWPETATLRFRQGHFRQRKYSAPTPRHDTNRPHRTWRANRPAKTPGPCLGDRPRVPHARSGVRPALINALALRAPTWPALYNIPQLDRSFAGRRDEKTFTIRGESAAACEG